MSLIQRLSPITARLAHTMASRKARKVLAAKWPVGQPALAIYFGGPVGDLYQIKQWLPVFEKLRPKLPTVVLMKDAVAALKLANVSSLPILLAGNANVIEPLADSWGLKAIFYVNNNLANFSPLRLPHVRHIHLSHGESEKASMTSNQLKAYDYCFVAGQASADRIRSALTLFDDSHLKLIGRPQLDQLLSATPLQPSDGRKTVLYAPTWEGDRLAMAYSSVADTGEKWVKELLADKSLRVIYRPHPKTGTRSPHTRRADRNIRRLVEAAARSEANAGHSIDLQSDCNPALISADVAVFDISAMAMDFSALMKPYFISVPAVMESTLKDYPLWKVARPLGIHDGAALPVLLHEALGQGPKTDSERVVHHYFGETAFGAGFHRFQSAIDAVI